MPISFDAVLLAAGQSRRMGFDKALVPLPNGEPLWMRQWQLLETAGAVQRFLSVRAEQTWPPPSATRVVDQIPEKGPLVGIRAGFARSQADHLFALAVDLPGVPVSWIRALVDASGPGRGMVGAYQEGGNLFYEPLAALYPRGCESRIAAAIEAGQLALQPLLAEFVKTGLMVVRQISPSERASFSNWNQPTDIS